MHKLDEKKIAEHLLQLLIEKLSPDPQIVKSAWDLPDTGAIVKAPPAGENSKYPFESVKEGEVLRINAENVSHRTIDVTRQRLKNQLGIKFSRVTKTAQDGTRYYEMCRIK